MDLDLSGKHALVCGASEGIGRAAAHELALLGADVTVMSRRADALAAVVDGLPNAGTQHHGFITADVADTPGLRAAVETLVAERPVHVLINNTAGPAGGAVRTAGEDAFLDTFRRHLLANQALGAIDHRLDQQALDARRRSMHNGYDWLFDDLSVRKDRAKGNYNPAKGAGAQALGGMAMNIGMSGIGSQAGGYFGKQAGNAQIINNLM